MVQAFIKAGLALKYVDKVDEWDYISKTKYGGVGWVDIARMEDSQEVSTGKRQTSRTKSDVESFAQSIRKQVTARREEKNQNDGH